MQLISHFVAEVRYAFIFGHYSLILVQVENMNQSQNMQYRILI